MAGETRRVAKKVKTLPNRLVREGTKAAGKPLQAAYTRDSGGDRKLSGVPNMKPFRPSTSVRGASNVRGLVTITPRGPAKWLNDGTGPPGPTKPKGTFDKAERPALLAAKRAMGKMFNDALR